MIVNPPRRRWWPLAWRSTLVDVQEQLAEATKTIARDHPVARPKRLASTADRDLVARAEQLGADLDAEQRDRVIQTAATVIAAHRWMPTEQTCMCGWYRGARLHPVHVAEQLLAVSASVVTEIGTPPDLVDDTKDGGDRWTWVTSGYVLAQWRWAEPITRDQVQDRYGIARVIDDDVVIEDLERELAKEAGA